MRKLILVVFIFTACSKKEDKPTTDIKVLESVINTPVSGASMALYTSTWGGLGGRTLFQGVTDANGVCRVLSEDYYKTDANLNVTKEKYWPFEVQKSTTVYITPEGWLRIQVHQTGNYPAGSEILLRITSQNGTRSEFGYYDAVADGSILLKGFGGQQNNVAYTIVDAGHNTILDGSSINLSIPRFDTLKNIVLNY